MAKGAEGKAVPDRLRPFRAGAYGVHATVVTVFCLFVTWNVVRSVRAMTPPMPPAPSQPLAREDCVARASRLWESLEERRRSLATSGAVRPGQMDPWAEFRVRWLRGLREAQAGCAGAAGEGVPMRDVFRDLERLEDLYTTHAVQYTGEIGPTVDRFHAHLRALQKP